MIPFASDPGWLAAAWPGRRGARPRAIRPVPPARRGDRDADSALAALYEAHYRPLVRLAALLVPDLPTAEQIVQDAYVAMHSAGRGRPDPDSAVSYLYRSVIRRARSAPRQHAVPGKPGKPAASDAGQQANAALVTALRTLPARQHEVLVLRYYAGLTEAQIASATGVSPGAVRVHTARALAALHAKLGKPADLGR